MKFRAISLLLILPLCSIGCKIVNDDNSNKELSKKVLISDKHSESGGNADGYAGLQIDSKSTTFPGDTFTVEVQGGHPPYEVTSTNKRVRLTRIDDNNYLAKVSRKADAGVVGLTAEDSEGETATIELRIEVATYNIRRFETESFRSATLLKSGDLIAIGNEFLQHVYHGGYNSQLSVTRIDEDQNVDFTFGENGFFIHKVQGFETLANTVFELEDGRLFVLVQYLRDPKYTEQYGNTDYRNSEKTPHVLILSANGELLESYDFQPLMGIKDYNMKLKKGLSGSFYIYGYHDDPNDNRGKKSIRDIGYVIKMKSNGTVDTQFGDNGKIFIRKSPRSNGSKATALLAGSDGNILVAHYEKSYGFISQYSTAGEQILSFNNDNGFFKVLNPLRKGMKYDYVTPVYIIREQKLNKEVTKYVFGGIYKQTNSHRKTVGVFRLNSDGTLDETFGIDGFQVFTDFLHRKDNYSYYGETSLSLSFDRKGGIIFISSEVYRREVVMARRLDKNGQLDLDFGDQGLFYIHNRKPLIYVNSVVVRPDGRIHLFGQYGWSFSGQFMLINLF